MPNAKDLAADEFWRILFVGRSGSGKSTQSSKWGKPPRFMFDFDNRIQSIAGADVEFYQPAIGSGWDKVDPTLTKLLQAAKKDQYPYNVTIMSSVTASVRLMTKDAIANEDSGIMKRGRLKIPGLRQYLYRAEALQQLYFDNILTFPGDKIIEAHLVDEFDENMKKTGNEKILAPGNFGQELPGYFNEIWQFEKESSTNASAPRKYMVYFDNRGESRSAIPKLREVQQLDITGKNLYEEVMKILA